MHPSTSEKQNYPALDGLRGIAILLVVFYHNFGFINYFFFGWLGVDLFFVLSGFLITTILLKDSEKPFFLRNFFIRRALRIFPLYYLVLFISLVLLPTINNFPLSLDYYIEHQGWLWTYLQNWLYIFNPTEETNVLAHLWSLAVEEQFYLLWPFAILYTKSFKKLFYLAAFLLIAIIFIRLAVWIYKIEDLAYFNLYTFSRVDGILIGIMLALLQAYKPDALKKYFTLIVFGLAGLNFIFFFFNRQNHFSFPYLAIAGYTTFAVLFGLLIHEAVFNQNKLLNWLFTLPVLIFFGRISYGLYVFHWPIYLYLDKVWGNKSAMGIPPKIEASVCATIIAILVSLLSFYSFERYFLNLKKKFI